MAITKDKQRKYFQNWKQCFYVTLASYIFEFHQEFCQNLGPKNNKVSISGR